MHTSCFTRVIALGAFAASLPCAGTEGRRLRPRSTPPISSPPAPPIENVTDEPGFEDGKVTPKAYCECVAGELDKNKLTQKDVDMLTKMHKDEISDDDAEDYPTLEDLMNANEGYEDACRRASAFRPTTAPTSRRSRRRRTTGPAGRRSSGRETTPRRRNRRLRVRHSASRPPRSMRSGRVSIVRDCARRARQVRQRFRHDALHQLVSR